MKINTKRCLPQLMTCLLLIWSSSHVYAQLITVSGKVTDAHNALPLPGATVIAGKAGTSTDKDGMFLLLVDGSVLREQGVTARYVGYRDQHLSYEGNALQFSLRADPKLLQTVTISGNAEDLVKKAFRRIPLNYIGRPFDLLGRINMLHMARDTSGYQYYYQNRASIKVHYDPYLKGGEPQVALLEKKDSLSFNRNSGFSVRYVDGYHIIANYDLVRARAAFLAGDLGKYTYQVSGREWVDGRRVFVVSFSAKARNKLNGTLYIDTADYAFVRISYTTYNIKKGIFLATDKRSVMVNYQRSPAGWVIDEIRNHSQTRHEGFDIERVTEFKNIQVDTMGSRPLVYRSVIPAMSEDKFITVSPETSITGTDSIILAKERERTDTTFTRRTTPAISTANKATFPQKVLAAYRDYVISDNLRLAIGLGTMPLKAKGYQALLSRNIAPISGYGLNTDIMFRLLRQRGFFVRLSNNFNLGLGGISLNEQAYSLSYDQLFNKTGHSITITPLIGRSGLVLRKGRTELYRQGSWIYGVSASYEISPRVNVFTDARYYRATEVTNMGMVVDKVPVVIQAGFIFKVKL